MRHGRGFRIPVLPSASSVVPARSGSMSCEAGGREASEAPPQTIELGGSAGVIAGGFILSTVGVVARVAMA